MQEETADPRQYDRTDARPDFAVHMHEKAAAGLSQGALGRAYENQACAVRPSLRERVNSGFYRAERESRNVDRLKELAHLLDTNPAIARILELIEATGV